MGGYTSILGFWIGGLGSSASAAPVVVNVDYYAEMSQATGYFAALSQATGYFAEIN